MDGSLPTFDERMAYIRSTHELEDQIVELAGHLKAGNYEETWRFRLPHQRIAKQEAVADQESTAHVRLGERHTS